MKKYILNKIILFLIITSYIFCQNLYENSLVIKNEIKFEIEIQDGFLIEGAELDFGNLLRGTNKTVRVKDNINLKTTYERDMIVKIQYEESESIEEEGYSKFQIFPKESNEVEENSDYLDVYIQNVEDMVLKAGEYKIPIIGEIREVGKDIKLGKYERILKANVTISSVIPSENLNYN